MSALSLDQGYERVPDAMVFGLTRVITLLIESLRTYASGNKELSGVWSQRARAIASEFNIHEDIYQLCVAEAANRVMREEQDDA